MPQQGAAGGRCWRELAEQIEQLYMLQASSCPSPASMSAFVSNAEAGTARKVDELSHDFSAPAVLRD